MQLIAVVMGSSTRDNRNAAAKALLDYGFANYSFVQCDGENSLTVPVEKGMKNSLAAGYGDFCAVVKKGSADKLTVQKNLPESVTAPVSKGDVVGRIVYMIDGQIIGESEVIASEDIPAMTFAEMFLRLLKKYIMV